MSYAAQVSAANPGCFLFLIDQSSSMSDRFGSVDPFTAKLDLLAASIRPTDPENALGSGMGASGVDVRDAKQSKAAFVTAVVNRFLNQLVLRCTSASGGVHDYFHVGLFGYGSDVVCLLKRDVMPISEIARSALSATQPLTGSGPAFVMAGQSKARAWLEPNAFGGTPMCKVLERAGRVVDNWLTEHRNAFPPIVVNLTDGEATDGDPLSPANGLRQLHSSDGAVLLFNCHISSHAGGSCQPF